MKSLNPGKVKLYTIILTVNNADKHGTHEEEADGNGNCIRMWQMEQKLALDR